MNVEVEPGNDNEDDARSAGGWRRVLGITLFVLHFALPVLALVLVPILGLPSGTNTLFWSGWPSSVGPMCC